MVKAIKEPSFPDHPLYGDTVLWKAFQECRKVIMDLRRMCNLKAVKILGRDVQLVEDDIWDAEVNTGKVKYAGYYITPEHRCYVRYDRKCQDDSSLYEQREERTRCAHVVSHEMIHHASRGGCITCEDLNEGITESLNHDPRIRKAIKNATGLFPTNDSYKKEQEMWRLMCRSNHRAAERILRHYWYGNGKSLLKELTNAFGTDVRKMLEMKEGNAKKVIGMIKGK